MTGIELPVEITASLLRWVAPHPDWKPPSRPDAPDDWDELVGCVLYDTGDAVTLIDPLLPRVGRERFLARLDELVGGRPVSVLTTIRWHRRDREQVAARYAASTSRARDAVPRGVVPRPIRGAGEVMYWLADARALVPGDMLLGDDDGGLRVCPEDWLGGVRIDRRGLAALLRPLLELPIERVLVSHGEPPLANGRRALERAIAQAEAPHGLSA